MWGYGHMGALGFGFGWIFMILFWALVIWAILAFVRGASMGGCCGGHHREEHGHREDSALQILKERYAKGEISKEDFERMKKDIQ